MARFKVRLVFADGSEEEFEYPVNDCFDYDCVKSLVEAAVLEHLYAILLEPFVEEYDASVDASELPFGVCASRKHYGNVKDAIIDSFSNVTFRDEPEKVPEEDRIVSIIVEAEAGGEKITLDLSREVKRIWELLDEAIDIAIKEEIPFDELLAALTDALAMESGEAFKGALKKFYEKLLECVKTIEFVRDHETIKKMIDLLAQEVCGE